MSTIDWKEVKMELKKLMGPKVYWLVYVDTADDPIRVLAVSKEDAKEQVQEMCYDKGYGELNVGCIGLVDIVQEAKDVL